MNDIALLFWRVNVGVTAAILVLICLRPLIRRVCGADVAYSTWIAVPVCGLAMSIDAGGIISRFDAPVRAFIAGSGGLLLAIWAFGAAIGAGLIVLGHRRMMRLARRGELGPAVTGLLEPRVRLPADFDILFKPDEQAAIRAHERAHLLRHDALANHALALGQCLFWFNPLVHIASDRTRRDQEMACDLTVMSERPEMRPVYARTLLKAQLQRPVPRLGCGWARHPLEERVRALGVLPSVESRVVGNLLLGFAAFQAFIVFLDTLN